MSNPTAERIRELLDYDRETGWFRWRNTPRKDGPPKRAGNLTQTGYRRIEIGGCEYREHRLAWLYVYGVWPTQDIDHINGVRDDNRIANLRLATRSQNLGNARRSSANKSGFKGVSSSGRKWKALIAIPYTGRYRYLGTFDTPEQAHAAYVRAARETYGEFARSA